MVQRVVSIVYSILLLTAVVTVDSAACSSYSKNNVGAVSDDSSCKKACQTGEGLKDGSCSSDKCSCKVKENSYRDICSGGCASASDGRRIAKFTPQVLVLIVVPFTLFSM
eukprot:gnl/MRDRNA2_/MRDRNA2_51831_c0_seq1.p1 gnl/MRDRNA2_/MRDRNA2_51831_c0~~gnl/MRDRNA2_/MRDRNA2_51831_c0_seq1.p1  ORF type:complete len:110 (-),score=12.57 gnl/MRDRNA2_/MRDRNA2_51831_c0_seq1:32-361(-)